MSLRTRFFLLVAVGSIVTATAAYVLHFRFLDNLERQTIDLRFSLRGDQAPPKDVVIVKVDDVTFNELNEQWPFPRTMHARLFDQIAGASRRRSPSTSSSPSTPRSRRTTRSATRCSATRASWSCRRPRWTRRASRTSSSTRRRSKELGARAGNANLPTDKDGIIRRFPYEVEKPEGLRRRRRRRSRAAGRSRARRWVPTTNGSTTPVARHGQRRTPTRAC